MRKQGESGQGSVQIDIDEDFGEYKLDSLECHEAGFDSLMTGYSFLKGACLLNTKLETLADPESFAK